jgi:hypothetical protein
MIKENEVIYTTPPKVAELKLPLTLMKWAITTEKIKIALILSNR